MRNNLVKLTKGILVHIVLHDSIVSFLYIADDVLLFCIAVSSGSSSALSTSPTPSHEDNVTSPDW